MSNDKLNLIEEIRKDIKLVYKNCGDVFCVYALDNLQELEDLIKQEVQE